MWYVSGFTWNWYRVFIIELLIKDIELVSTTETIWSCLKPAAYLRSSPKSGPLEIRNSSCLYPGRGIFLIKSLSSYRDIELLSSFFWIMKVIVTIAWHLCRSCQLVLFSFPHCSWSPCGIPKSRQNSSSVLMGGSWPELMVGNPIKWHQVIIGAQPSYFAHYLVWFFDLASALITCHKTLGGLHPCLEYHSSSVVARLGWWILLAGGKQDQWESHPC